MEGWVTDWALVRTKVLHGFRRSIKYNILTRVWAMASEEIKQFIIRWLNFHGIPCGKLGHNIKCIHESMICFWTVLLCFGPCVNWRNGFRFWCWPRIQLHVLFEFQNRLSQLHEFEPELTADWLTGEVIHQRSSRPLSSGLLLRFFWQSREWRDLASELSWPEGYWLDIDLFAMAA